MSTFSSTLNLDWSEPFKVETKKGMKLVQSAEPTDRFWRIWKEHRNVLKASGISVFKKDGRWLAFNWVKPEDNEPEDALTVISHINETRATKVLVICSVATRDVWKLLLQKQLKLNRSITLMDGIEPFPEKPQIVIINFDQCRKFMDELRNVNWSTVVIDGIHNLDNRTTARSVAILGNEDDISPITAKKVLIIDQEN